MQNTTARERIEAFGRQFDYDVGYMHEVLDASPEAYARLEAFGGMPAYCEEVPLEAWYAAKLASTLSEDCGPCVQLGVTIAERHGIRHEVLRAIIAGDFAAMGADASLGLRYARSALARDIEADALREEIVARWGRKALLSLAYAAVSTRTYPALKYALGHGRSCVRVRVGDTDVVPAHAAPALSAAA